MNRNKTYFITMKGREKSNFLWIETAWDSSYQVTAQVASIFPQDKA
jgi:hypothetical protein